jgi:hypothetical protein
MAHGGSTRITRVLVWSAVAVVATVLVCLALFYLHWGLEQWAYQRLGPA